MIQNALLYHLTRKGSVLEGKWDPLLIRGTPGWEILFHLATLEGLNESSGNLPSASGFAWRASHPQAQEVTGALEKDTTSDLVGPPIIRKCVKLMYPP